MNQIPLGTLDAAAVPAGGGGPAVHSVTVSTNQGQHDLRTLALNNGWDGIQDLDLTVTYTANQIGTATSTPLIATGTIANADGQSKIKVIINSGIELRGKGGKGGNGSTSISNPDGGDGGDGQDCFDINTGDTSIPIEIANNGTYWSGGGGGGGGTQGTINSRDGGGGGGGASTGAGGASPQGNPGAAATNTNGGAGGAADVNSGKGGNGGNRGLNGQAGSLGNSGTPGAKGVAGKRLRKNGHTVTQSGTGTSFGTATA